MPLWGTTHDSAANKPKWAPVDEDSDNRRGDIYASNAGWVQQAGTAASGNNNTDADPEVLVAIGMLAGISAATGLKTPTVTAMRFVVGTTAATDFTAGSSSQTLLCQVTWDESITVTGNPTVVVANGNQGTGTGRGPYTLVYTATGSTANRKRFILASQTIAEDDILTLGGANIVLAGGTLKDQGTTPADASLVLSGLTAVTHTVLA
ncbi:uncharacterized protein METZ01_LOCUS151806 [marine metagenome]|uniref:Uncharacterized protein n=1 Tax=marine metagenome TaxID=408172 RepID=A0A382ACY7_9ZZZZ|tara:strand:- start:2878 stop:3498 length:621 start_codon:yes stop_codon:yes gene_type:complete